VTLRRYPPFAGMFFSAGASRDNAYAVQGRSRKVPAFCFSRYNPPHGRPNNEKTHVAPTYSRGRVVHGSSPIGGPEAVRILRRRPSSNCRNACLGRSGGYGACCTLSPPVDAVGSGEGGHFIRTKDGPPYRILGTISFRAGTVSRISQPLDLDFDGYNDEAVRLARALYRALAPITGDSSSTVLLSVQHMRMSNAERDTLSLSFPNGRGIELQVITLDSPDKETNKRDAVTLDEILESPR